MKTVHLLMCCVRLLNLQYNFQQLYVKFNHWVGTKCGDSNTCRLNLYTQQLTTWADYVIHCFLSFTDILHVLPLWQSVGRPIVVDKRSRRQLQISRQPDLIHLCINPPPSLSDFSFSLLIYFDLQDLSLNRIVQTNVFCHCM